jgi:hypothetical protein
MKFPSHAFGIPPALRGYQVVSVEEGEVTIYGDPEGLRSLAKVLQFVADINQSLLQDGMPTEDSFHCHVFPGEHFSVPSLPLRIGRVDTASGRFRDEVFASPKRRRRKRKG